MSHVTNDRLAHFFFASVDPMCIAGADGRFKSVNPAFVRKLGFSELELLKIPYLEFVHSDDRERTIIVARKILSGETVQEFEIRMICKDQSEVLLSWNCIRHENEILAIARDVTVQTRVAIDQAVREAERVFKAAFEQSGLGFALSDLDGHLFRLNDEFARSLNHSAAELMGRPIVEALMYSSSEFDLDQLRDGRADKVVHEYKTKFDDRSEWYLSTTSLILNPDGTPRCFLTANKNITVRKMAEERLTKSEDDFRMLAKTLPTIVWTSEGDGRVTYVNQQWFDLTNSSPHEDFNQTWANVMHPEDREPCLAKFAEAMVHAKPFVFEYRLWSHVDNGYRWHLGRSTPVSNAEGKISKWIGTATDIDAQVRVQEELQNTIEQIRKVNSEKSELLASERAAQEASRLKSEFLANMSHEIRTPLNGIVGMTSLLLETKLSRTQADYSETILASSESLMAIINDILDLSKIEAGKLEIAHHPFSLQALVVDIEKVIGFSATAKGLQFNVELPTKLKQMTFEGDAARIRQVLFNLVQNAVKFTASGSVDLVITHEGLNEARAADVRFEVRDTGIGIDAETSANIFEPFEQADNSTTRRFGGTGLGLSICKKLVSAMGGGIGFESQPGTGSTFWFAIPLAIEIDRPRISKSKKRTQKKLDANFHADILVAEDHPINQRVIQTILENQGCRVTLVSTGKKAVDWASKKKFDLIFMDCHMPELDGFGAAEQIRKLKYVGPIVALTADVLKGTRERCLAAGMNGYLSKPVNSDEVAKIVSGLDRASTVPAARNSFEVFNPEALSRLDQLGPSGPDSLTVELVSGFLTDTPRKLMGILTDLKSGDVGSARFQVHSIKSTAGLVGADKFSSICADLERKLLIRNPNDILLKFHILTDSFDATRVCLEQVLTERRAAV